MDAREVGAAIASTDGVVGVHDLHLWTITSGVPGPLGTRARRGRGGLPCNQAELEVLLREPFELTHTTLQVEHAPGLIKLAQMRLEGKTAIVSCASSGIGAAVVRDLRALVSASGVESGVSNASTRMWRSSST